MPSMFPGRHCSKVCHGTTVPKELFFSPEPDDDFVDPADEYLLPWEEPSVPEVADPLAGIDKSYAAMIGLEICGTNDFIADAQELVASFRDIFSKELSPEPADLPPLDVPIDTTNPEIRVVRVIYLLRANRR